MRLPGWETLGLSTRSIRYFLMAVSTPGGTSRKCSKNSYRVAARHVQVSFGKMSKRNEFDCGNILDQQKLFSHGCVTETIFSTRRKPLCSELAIC